MMGRVLLLIALLPIAVPAWPSAAAAEPPQCARSDMVLWGDGRHDDTAALNAWLRGDILVWAETGEPVGPVIADHTFRLSAAVYAVGGNGRKIERFRLLCRPWPPCSAASACSSSITALCGRRWPPTR